MDQVNAIAELELSGIDFDPAGENEVKLKCPCHDDNTPSVCLNVEKNLWICHACKRKGDFIALLAHFYGKPRSVIVVELGKRYDLENVKEINSGTVEKFHGRIFEAGPLLQQLRKRAVTDEMIRYARLGFHDGRITIPVYDAQKRIVNIRRYQPGAPGPQKMRNTPKYGKMRIYQVEDLKYQKILLVGGEIKALVTGFKSRAHGYGCISVTGGEGSWDVKWSSLLKDKDVCICMDIDIAGREATNKLCNLFKNKVRSLSVIRIPLDKNEYPKGDLNDYFSLNNTFENLIAGAKEFAPQKPQDAETIEIKNVSLKSARDAKYVGKKISFDAVITAMEQTPFIVPHEVRVMCDRAQTNCGVCPIYSEEDVPTITIPPSSEGLLGMVDAPKKIMGQILQETLRIPPCKSVSLITTAFQQISDVRLSPQLSLSNEVSGDLNQAAHIVHKNVDLNIPYKFAGILYPHPRTQQAVLMLDEAEETDDSLDTFFPSPTELELLKVFQPEAWTLKGVKEKLNDIYKDFESNVTHILCRRELHLIIDLTYHSCLFFNFDERQVHGWINSLIVGDSSQGKSETSLRLMEHYGLGERVECKNASVAGLVGGLQQIGTRWFVSWGVIPQHDRRLVILEEVKGASTKVLGKLTDMRSSGLAEIPKIERRRANARTRLIFISNPRSNRPIASFGFGIEAIKELIGNLEDIRRFDIALITSEAQVDSDEITKRVKRKHVYSSQLCRKLVLFAWTQKEIQFDDGVEKLIQQQSRKLCKNYSETLPLVDKGTMRHKLARLSIALAIRTFSVNSKHHVLVRKCHVEMIIDFLDKIYSDAYFGYKEFSKIQNEAENVVDKEEVSIRIQATKHPKDFVKQLLRKDEITLQDLEDLCELDIDDARSFVSFFVRKHCLFREGQVYHKTPDFIQILKDLSITAPTGVEVALQDEL